MNCGIVILGAWNVQLTPALALAAVAVLAYLLGRKYRPPLDPAVSQTRREIRRAERVAQELDTVSDSLRRSLARHQTSVERFKARVQELRGRERDEGSWKQLCSEAEAMLRPTLRLAAQVAQAYDEIRQQSNQLMAFTEVRTDPLTGLSNRRSLDEALASLIALKTRYHSPFSLVMLDIDHFKKVNDKQGHLGGDRLLQEVARLIDDTVRETDLAARFGGEEFVVLMPQTRFDGATILGERLRIEIELRTSLTVSVGVAEALDAETAANLLGRVDAALYAAKAAGRNRAFFHDGTAVDAVTAIAVAESA